MEQFVVPQFIDVEDKIFGPLSVRQFVIFMVGCLLLFLEYRLADFALFILEGLPTLMVSLILAFAKVNGMPFHFFLVNFIQTLKRPRIRLWQKSISEAELRAELHHPVAVVQAPTASAHKPVLSQSRLSELTLVVDTGGAYQPEEEDRNQGLEVRGK